jgi:hypothetical protein
MTTTAVAMPSIAVVMTTTVVAMPTIRGDGPKVRDRSGVPLACDYIFYFTTASGCDVC